jgi:hypothetical protein
VDMLQALEGLISPCDLDEWWKRVHVTSTNDGEAEGQVLSF